MHKNLDLNLAVELYQSGLSLRDVAKRLHTNHTTVREYLTNLGIHRRTVAESQKGKPRPYSVKPLHEKPCAYCCKPIKDKPGHLKRRTYCSYSCNAKAQVHSKLERPILICEWCGKQYQPKEVFEAKERRFCSHSCSLAWNVQFINGNTELEKTVGKWLEDKNIPFYTQVPISRFFADIVLDQFPIIIECDGSYWHNLPGIPQRDRMRNIIMRRMGYSVIRLTDTDIKKYPEHSLNRIYRIIKRYT